MGDFNHLWIKLPIVTVVMGFNQEDHPMLVSTGAPFLLGLSYVASLYVSKVGKINISIALL